MNHRSFNFLLFSRFVKDGGCTVLNKWLQEGMASQNVSLILDVLEVSVLYHYM